MATKLSAAYPLGGTQTEQERLLAQAEGRELQACQLLDQITSSQAGEFLISVAVR